MTSCTGNGDSSLRTYHGWVHAGGASSDKQRKKALAYVYSSGVARALWKNADAASKDLKAQVVKLEQAKKLYDKAHAGDARSRKFAEAITMLKNLSEGQGKRLVDDAIKHPWGTLWCCERRRQVELDKEIQSNAADMQAVLATLRQGVHVQQGEVTLETLATALDDSGAAGGQAKHSTQVVPFDDTPTKYAPDVEAGAHGTPTRGGTGQHGHDHVTLSAFESSKEMFGTPARQPS